MKPSCRWADEGRGAYPVYCVMGSQAAAYCEFCGWRLPTKAEWPHALTASHDLFDRAENGFEWVVGSDPRHAALRLIRVEASAQLGARAPRVAAALLGPGRSFAPPGSDLAASKPQGRDGAPPCALDTCPVEGYIHISG
ncbi:MAG: SUMF1/EgtB/PvdO family nonheme iron enzyme [Nannocystaceae bacterium]